MRATWWESRLFSQPRTPAELEQPHPAVGPVGERDEHHVVRVRQAGLGRELAGELTLEAHLHELQRPPRPLLPLVQPAHVVHMRAIVRRE